MKISDIEKSLSNSFAEIDDIAFYNQKKVIDSFRDCRISNSMFSCSTGYGYDDQGRDNLARLFAKIFGAEKALISPIITCGTHAISIALYGLLRPNDVMLSITGKPYDTLTDTLFGKGNGSLEDFKIKVEKVVEDVKRYPVVLKYRGYNLIEDCGGISLYEELIADDFAFNQITFDLEKTNNQLMEIEVEERLNESLYRDDFKLALDTIRNCLDQRDINNFQVIKLISETVSYWVILKVQEGYMLQMYEDYDDLLEGFYYTDYSFSDNIFTHCWTFLLLNFKFETKLSIDNNGRYIALKNEPGYIPDLIKTSEGAGLLKYLNDLAIGLSGNNEVTDEDEMLEIEVYNGIYQASNIFVHEIKVDFNHFDCHYSPSKSITNQNILNQKVCLDVVALPFNAFNHDNKLDIYGVIVSEDDYIVRKIESPTVEKINKILIDIIIDFSNQYGKPQYLAMSNLNILFIVYDFLRKNNIGYHRDQVFQEVDEAIIDAFGLEDEILRLLDDPSLKAVLDEFDVFDEQELEEKLNQIANDMDLLN